MRTLLAFAATLFWYLSVVPADNWLGFVRALCGGVFIWNGVMLTYDALDAVAGRVWP